jgi:hypothetical protein
MQFSFLSLMLGLILGLGTQLFVADHISFWPINFGVIALFLFFLRLRLFDEFKDYEHDVKFYPQRPIPRELVNLREIRILIFPLVALELAVALKSGTLGQVLFLISFTYSLLMFKEFFIRDWLRKHFTLYVFTHELLVLPLFLYICAINGAILGNINWLFFGNLVVLSTSLLFLLEVARKTRPKASEIASRDTYTAQYGVFGASSLIATISCLAVATMATNLSLLSKPTLLPIVIVLAAMSYLLYCLYLFTREATIANAKIVFKVSIIFFAVVSIISIIVMSIK